MRLRLAASEIAAVDHPNSSFSGLRRTPTVDRNPAMSTSTTRVPTRTNQARWMRPWAMAAVFRSAATLGRSEELPGANLEQLDHVAGDDERVGDQRATLGGDRSDEGSVRLGQEHLARGNRPIGQLGKRSKGEAVSRTGAADHDRTAPADRKS